MLSRRCCPSLVGVTFVLSAVAAFAQPAPRPLTHSDFDAWRAVGTPIVSREGRWLAYSYMPQDGNGDVVVREISTGREHRVPVGALPPPPTTPDENAPSEAPPPPRTVKLAFTSDSRFAIVQTYPTKADVAAARRAKKKADEMPKAGLAILDLDSGNVTRVADVKSFVVPTKGGSWLAYLKEGKPEPKPIAVPTSARPTAPSSPASGPAATAPEATATSTSPAASATSPTPAATPPRPAATTPVLSSERTFGTDLVVRELATGAERRFEYVRDYSFARDGRTLLYTVSAWASTNNGVYAVTPGDAAKPVALLAGRGRYARLAWDREETQVTFVSDRDAAGQRNAPFKQYWWRRGSAGAQTVVSSATQGLPADFVVSDKASGAFSRDGKKLYVAVGARPKPGRGAPAGEGNAAPVATVPD